MDIGQDESMSYFHTGDKGYHQVKEGLGVTHCSVCMHACVLLH